MSLEDFIFLIAAFLYAWAVIAALISVDRYGEKYVFPLTLLGLALAFTAASIGLRWNRLGHGPYVDFRETMISSVFGYHLAVFLACIFVRQINAIIKPILPVLFLLVIWTLFVPSTDSLLPVTYATYWLPLHVIFGKIFIGCTIVALSLAGSIILRSAPVAAVTRNNRLRLKDLPPDDALEELAFRFMFIAFIFHTLMLISGAVWAEDAWGRYWAWDPLETWSFITWLIAAGYLHLRVTRRLVPAVSGVFICLIFGFAFFTFFGVPFISVAAHKGMV